MLAWHGDLRVASFQVQYRAPLRGRLSGAPTAFAAAALPAALSTAAITSTIAATTLAASTLATSTVPSPDPTAHGLHKQPCLQL